MDIQGFCDLRILSASYERVTIHTLAFCTLFLGGLAFAQQSSEPGANVNRHEAGAETVAQNAADSEAESSSQQNQAQTQTSLPDAPSASQCASSSVGSLTFANQASIYSHAIIRPYTLVGPALSAGIGQRTPAYCSPNLERLL